MQINRNLKTLRVKKSQTMPKLHATKAMTYEMIKAKKQKHQQKITFSQIIF